MHRLPPHLVVMSIALDPFAVPFATSLKLTDEGLAVMVKELTEASGEMARALATRIACAGEVQVMKLTSAQITSPNWTVWREILSGAEGLARAHCRSNSVRAGER